MRLAAGEYLGTTHRELEHQGVRFSLTDYQPLQEQPWHTHERTTLFVHLCGEQLDEHRSAHWPMPTLAVTYHPTFTPHRSRVGPRGARGVNLEVSETWLEAHGLRPSDLGEHRVLSSGRVRSSAMQLVATYTPTPPANQALGDMALDLLEAFVAPRLGTDQIRPCWLARVEEQVRERFREPLSSSELAAEAGVHMVHLARVFRRRHGCSVTRYIQRLRLEAAAEQILAGDTLVNAALDAGFSDQSHFSRILKAQMGYSPKVLKALRASLHQRQRARQRP